MAKELKFKQGEYKEAVDYFRQKINLPTKKWNDLEGAMHTRAFTVAGAMRDDILADFRNAVDKAIANGETLQDFRDRFHEIAGRWRETDANIDAKLDKRGYAAWRSRIIYQTNMNTASAAAAERQARDPELEGIFTHAKYICQMLPGSREEHKAWNGTVLPINDPWWDLHTPPNGFGCLCEKEFISKYEMKAGLEKETKRPTAPDDTTNIGENWDYSIGDADLGNVQREKAAKEWDTYAQDGKWRNETDTKVSQKNTMEAPESTPLTADPDKFAEGFMDRLKEAFGKDKNATFNDDSMTLIKRLGGNDYPIYVEPKIVGKHIIESGHPERTRMANYFIDTLKNPSDYRFQFKKSDSGKAAISLLLVGMFKSDKSKTPIQLLIEGVGGRFQMFTAGPAEALIRNGITGSKGK